MTERPQAADVKAGTEGAAPAAAPASPPPRRSPGHRGTDIRDTVAEMAARAQEISQEAGSRMAGAMRDVINAAAGLAGFSIDSARDLVQYMVRRGQMTAEEAEKLLKEAEEAQPARGTTAAGAAAGPRPAAKPETPKAPEPVARAAEPPVRAAEPARAEPAPVKSPVVQHATEEPDGYGPPAREAKPAAKAAAKDTKPAPKAAAAPAKPAAKGATKVPQKPGKAAAKPAAKAAAKPAAKAGAKTAKKGGKKR